MRGIWILVGLGLLVGCSEDVLVEASGSSGGTPQLSTPAAEPTLQNVTGEWKGVLADGHGWTAGLQAGRVNMVLSQVGNRITGFIGFDRSECLPWIPVEGTRSGDTLTLARVPNSSNYPNPANVVYDLTVAMVGDDVVISGTFDLTTKVEEADLWALCVFNPIALPKTMAAKPYASQ